MRWYADRDLPVTPITPSSKSVLSRDAVASISQLPPPPEGNQDGGVDSGTSLSIVTPPKVTRSILEEALQHRGKIRSIWLQPGAEDDQVIEYIQDNDWLKQRTVYGGPCVLVLGDKLRKEAAAAAAAQAETSKL